MTTSPRARTLVLAIALASSGLPTPPPASAQNATLGGASRPRPQNSINVTDQTSDDQYKRVHQVALRHLLAGQITEAGSVLEDFESAQPGDPETAFVTALVAAHRGLTDQAVRHLEKALAAGLPPERILAGPRPLLEGLRDTPLVTGIASAFADQPVHGPMLGSVTDLSAGFWVRTAQPARVTIHATSIPGGRTHQAAAHTTPASDLTAVVTLSGLRPATSYHYGVQIDDGPVRTIDRFRTFPAARGTAGFRIVFGGGAGFVPPNERVWDTIRAFHPDALLLLGDNVYSDDPESPGMQRYCYYRRQSRPEFRKLVAATPVFSIWDDHDFGTNDCWGGPDVLVPEWKHRIVYPIFRENWVNPGYGGGFEQPGCYYSFSIGPVDFFMLDCRYYRTNPRAPVPSMLGPVQKQWLRAALARSQGAFRVLCSSVPWDYRTKGDSLDTWNGFRSERDEIFSWIDELRLDGVLLMSADRHRSDAWRIDRTDAYPLFEFNSSRLTNQHVHGTMEKHGALFSYNAKQSFGMVDFSFQEEDPSVSYRVVSIDGEIVHHLRLHRSDLVRNR